MNQEHCNVVKIVQLFLSWKKNLIIYKQFLLYFLKKCKFKTKITMYISYFYMTSIVRLQWIKLHDISNIAIPLVPFCKIQSKCSLIILTSAAARRADLTDFAQCVKYLCSLVGAKHFTPPAHVTRCKFHIF